MEISPDATFELRIDFERNSGDPARVFKTMSGIIDTFDDLDNALLAPFNFEVDPILLLQDVESGSLRTRLATVIRSTDDEAIKELNWKKLVGAYLLNAKYWLLKQLEGKSAIETRDELLAITRGINDLAEQTDIQHIAAYQQVSPRRILYSIKRITKSLSFLKSGDSAEYIAHREIVNFNIDFEYREDMEEALLTDTSTTHTTSAVVKVKKPDFLGASMWEFKYRGHQVRAKMVDHNWLLAFQTNAKRVLPGDALRVTLETTTNFDDHGIEIGSHYKVLRVDEIIRADYLPGDDMFDE